MSGRSPGCRHWPSLAQAAKFCCSPIIVTYLTWPLAALGRVYRRWNSDPVCRRFRVGFEVLYQRPYLVLQHLQPGSAIGGVIVAHLGREVEVGTQKGSA